MSNTKANIEKSEVKDLNVKRYAAEYTAKLADSIAPANSSYIGCACVFFYKKSYGILSNEPDVTFSMNVDLTEIPEKIADIGVKILSGEMMKKYARKDPFSKNI